MSKHKTEISEEMIHAYVDKQLNTEDTLALEQILQNDTELAEKVRTYQAINAQLHSLYDPLLTEEIPDFLSARPKISKTGRLFLNMAASLVLLTVGGVSGWFMREGFVNEHDVLQKLVRPAASAHVVYLPEVKHPVEVTADQEKHLVKWLSKRLGKTINTPNLIELGYQLVGGRLLPSERGPAALFMYENSTGERLTLYVQSNELLEKNTAFRFSESGSTKSFYWIDDNLGYVLSGNTTKSQLLDTAHSVYQQLSFQ